MGFMILGGSILVAAFLLACGLAYVVVAGAVAATNWIEERAKERHDAKAQHIAQHSVTVEVD